jgi:hypothetical protein
LSLAYRWIQHSPNFKICVRRIVYAGMTELTTNSRVS